MPHVRPTSVFRSMRLIAMLVAVALLVAACGNDDNDELSTDANPAVEGSQPTPGAALNERVEEVTLTIEGGKVSEGTVTLQVDEPVVMRVVNNDATGYRLRIPGLVADATINPSTTTNVSFSTPNTESVEAQLLPATGEEPVATFQVEVQGPTGESP